MDNKEEAKELVERFKPLVTTWDCYSDCPAQPEEILKDAKACALIAVDFAIKNYQDSVLKESIDFITTPNPIERLEALKEAIQSL